MIWFRANILMGDVRTQAEEEEDELWCLLESFTVKGVIVLNPFSECMF